eukprot:scaffold421267_cov60-Attheya_sp.AAC.6
MTTDPPFRLFFGSLPSGGTLGHGRFENLMQIGFRLNTEGRMVIVIVAIIVVAGGVVHVHGHVLFQFGDLGRQYNGQCFLVTGVGGFEAGVEGGQPRISIVMGGRGTIQVRPTLRHNPKGRPQRRVSQQGRLGRRPSGGTSQHAQRHTARSLLIRPLEHAPARPHRIPRRRPHNPHLRLHHP